MCTGADPEVALWVLNPCSQLRIRDLVRRQHDPVGQIASGQWRILLA